MSEFCTTKWIKILIQQERKLIAAEQKKKVSKEEFSPSCLFSKWITVLDKNIQSFEDSLINKKKTGKLDRDVEVPLSLGLRPHPSNLPKGLLITLTILSTERSHKAR